MNYTEALKYMDNAGRSGIRPGLDRIRELLARMGNPQDKCRIVHAAGTNGKGSVCTMIAAGLQAAGYTVGRYISPAVYGRREIIQKNGQWISEEDAAALITKIAQITKDDEDKPTAFETETAMAYAYFAESGCDAAVVETGMGGRLDATNVIAKPWLCVITDIAMDHMQFLGNTIEEIAGEKAGILMPGCPAVFCRGDARAAAVLEAAARERGIDYRFASPSEVTNIRRSLESGQTFDYNGYKDLNIRLLGTCQIANAVTAVDAMEMLGLSEENIRTGLREAVWPGRFDIVQRSPLLLEDGAHNPDGAAAQADSIRKYLPDRKIVLIMGVFADKDYDTMLRIMAEVSDTVYTFRPPGRRGLDAGMLARAAGKYFTESIACATQREAVQAALTQAGSGGAAVHFGSLSTLAGLRQIAGGKRNENRQERI